MPTLLRLSGECSHEEQKNLQSLDWREFNGINEKHAAIAISQEVKDGQLVQFHLRNPLAAAEEIRAIIAQLAEKTEQHPPDFGLYFNCLGRGKGLYGAENHDISVIQE